MTVSKSCRNEMDNERQKDQQLKSEGDNSTFIRYANSQPRSHDTLIHMLVAAHRSSHLKVIPNVLLKINEPKYPNGIDEFFVFGDCVVDPELLVDGSNR